MQKPLSRRRSLRGPVFLLQMSHAATSALCRSIKLQCELYPSRQIAICLDPYCGLGFALWCLCRYGSGALGLLMCAQPSLEPQGMDMGEPVKETQINLFISGSENTFCGKKIHLSQLVT